MINQFVYHINIYDFMIILLGCAYADGTLTAEQMLLAAYARGLVSLDTKCIFGSMAAIGLSYEQIKDMVPEGIEEKKSFYLKKIFL